MIRKQPRSGLTLIELLFVILIIGILVGLLLPAIQNARQAARRLTCSKNVNQLILAVNLYQHAHQYFPPGVIDNTPGPVWSQALGVHHSWIAQILPQIQDNVTYQSLDFGVSIYHPKNNAARKISPAILICPSMGGSPSPFAMTNYAAVHHDTAAPISSDNHGSFYLNSSLRPRDIADGLGQTIFLGEMVPFPGSLGYLSGTRSSLRNFGIRLGMTAIDARGNPWVTSLQIGQSMPAGVAPKPREVGGFGGVHRTTTTFAFADGHVQQIANTIDLLVLQQLGHRSDSAPLDNKVIWNRAH